MNESIELIHNYIKFKASAERLIGHPWNDEEMKKIVKQKISELKIEELLTELVETGWITCPQCGEQIMVNRDCNKCRWQNPLSSLRMLYDL